jgi:phosphomannomutase/phosphoglucomutase
MNAKKRKGGAAAKAGKGKDAATQEPASRETSARRTSSAVPGRKHSANPLDVSRPSAAPLLAAAALVASVLIAVAYVQTLVITPANDAHEARLASAHADHIAEQVALISAGIRAPVRQTGAASQTFTVLRSGDEARIAAHEARLAALLPGAQRVRLNLAGEADIALTEVPPLTFAGVDLIRRAETSGEVAGPEFLATDAGPVVNVAAPVPGDGGRPLGSVLVSFDGNVIAGPVRGLADDLGAIEVLQSIGGGQRNAVVTHGVGSGATALEREVDASPWTVRFTPAVVDPVASPFMALPAWLMILAITAVGVLIGHRRLRGAMETDLDRLLESVNAAASGRSPVPGKDYLLDPFAVAGAILAQLTDDLRGMARRRREPVEKVVTRPPPEPAPGTTEVTVEEVEDDDDDFLDLGDDDDDDVDVTQRTGDDPVAAPEPVEPATVVPRAEIFRAYDIRGVVGDTLTADVARAIGRAVGSEALDRGEQTVIVAADGRHSSPELAEALIAGLTASGRDVIDLGAVPTPVLYWATCELGPRSGVMVTGSHNASEYNGFKVVLAGEALAGDAVTDLRRRLEEGRLTNGEGSVERRDVVAEYIDRIASDIALAQPLKVVIDCGNGIAGAVAPALLEALGCEVIPLYCDVDGDFPNHHPDPADPANLQDLRTVVRAEGADLGLAMDGDGDRLGMITERGDIIWPDHMMMLFARDIVGRNPGADVVFDVKCSRHLNAMIADFGGRPIMWRSGHSNIKAKMKETGALLGGEFSGHICFGERWYGFDDAFYSAARLLEIIGGEALTASEVFAEFPTAVSTPELKIETGEARKFELIEQLAGAFGDGDVNDIDGLRVDYPDGWGLIRASNTSPVVTLRFEADDREAMVRIADRFRSALQDVDPALDFKLPA